jgi:non-specific protein-tyrosine kinase
MELRHYGNILLKWWWLLLISMLVAGAASYLASRSMPRLYQSRTTLMVGQALQNPNPNSSEFYTGQALAQSYTDLVKREPVLRDTLQALGLQWDWVTLQNMITSRVVPGTQLMEIAVIDTDPQRAKIVVDELANQLIRRSPGGNAPEQEAERKFLLAQIEDIKRNIQQAQGEITQLSSVIAKATSARDIQDARDRQASLQTQVTEWQSTYAQMLTNLNVGNTNSLSVVELAQVPSGPVGSGATTNVIMAVAVGLALAAAAAFLLEYLDDTIKTVDDVRRTANMTVLGGITTISGKSQTDKLISVNAPRSPITEAYRALRTNLQFSLVDSPLRALVVTSANPQEGKSITAANLAVVMAQLGKRVALIDADLRKPAQHKIFALTNTSGLTNILFDTSVRWEDVMQSGPAESLRIVTSGALPPNPSEMLGSKRMIHLIEELQQQVDLIIFDAPPALAVTDALVLSNRVDGVLLVINAGRTRRAHLVRTKEALDTVGAHVLGATLNRISRRRKGEYQYDYYFEGKNKRKFKPDRTAAAQPSNQRKLDGGQSAAAQSATSTEPAISPTALESTDRV